MLKPQGYVTIATPDAPTVERDSVTCAHCNRVVLVKPGTASTVYLFPQLVGPDKEEAGAGCRQCMKAICLTCYDNGRCTPLEKQIEHMEARDRFRRAVGV